MEVRDITEDTLDGFFVQRGYEFFYYVFVIDTSTVLCSLKVECLRHLFIGIVCPRPLWTISFA